MGIMHTQGRAVMLGGPLDGRVFGDMPILEGGLAPEQISIPLTQPADTATRAHYSRRDPAPVDGKWYYTYTHSTLPGQEPGAGAVPGAAPLGDRHPVPAAAGLVDRQ